VMHCDAVAILLHHNLLWLSNLLAARTHVTPSVSDNETLTFCSDPPASCSAGPTGEDLVCDAQRAQQTTQELHF